jgi:N-methylhydantoinase B
MEGLCDREPVETGAIIRIDTTGGGGWGDPLERDVDAVALDVLQGKVTRDCAAGSYGVILTGNLADGGPLTVDAAATAARRAELAAERGEPNFFNRGPGYQTLSGQTSADLDQV